MARLYEMVCGNCKEKIEVEQEIKVGDMTKCSLCDSYALILSMDLLPSGRIFVMCRRVPQYEAREMGYP
jgi:DNA-directed RNA polymerase subunit RPC12/RpoP